MKAGIPGLWAHGASGPLDVADVSVTSAAPDGLVSNITCIAPSPDETLLALGTDSFVALLDAMNLKHVRVLKKGV
mgnify:FL=1